MGSGTSKKENVMSKDDMEKILDEAFRKVFGEASGQRSD